MFPLFINAKVSGSQDDHGAGDGGEVEDHEGEDKAHFGDMNEQTHQVRGHGWLCSGDHVHALLRSELRSA